MGIDTVIHPFAAGVDCRARAARCVEFAAIQMTIPLYTAGHVDLLPVGDCGYPQSRWVGQVRAGP
jgi:hypothetical protein